jgi:hypothetical protein
MLWASSARALDPLCSERYQLLIEARARRAGVSPADYQTHQRELNELEELRARALAPRDYTPRQRKFLEISDEEKRLHGEEWQLATARQNHITEQAQLGLDPAAIKAQSETVAFTQKIQDLRQRRGLLSKQITEMREEGRGLYEAEESATTRAYRERVQATPAYAEAMAREARALEKAEAHEGSQPHDG